jgi:hypothetical protein
VFRRDVNKDDYAFGKDNTSNSGRTPTSKNERLAKEKVN